MATIDIEAVVMEVVRRLLPTAAPVETADKPSADNFSTVKVISRTEVINPAPVAPKAASKAPEIAPASSPAPSVAVATTLSVLSVPGKVITLQSLEGRLAGIAEIKVEPRAIVTPAVNDELRKRSIRLIRSASTATGTKAAVAKLLVASQIPAELAVRTQSLLAAASIPYETLQSASTPKLVDVAKELAFKVTSGRQLGLFLTNQPAVASSVLQKMVGVRAYPLSDVTSLQDALASLAPNIVVADARKLDRHNFGALVGQFVVAGYRDCPPELRGIL